jgi:hypothetical protein
MSKSNIYDKVINDKYKTARTWVHLKEVNQAVRGLLLSKHLVPEHTDDKGNQFDTHYNVEIDTGDGIVWFTVRITHLVAFKTCEEATPKKDVVAFTCKELRDVGKANKAVLMDSYRTPLAVLQGSDEADGYEQVCPEDTEEYPQADVTQVQ